MKKFQQELILYLSAADLITAIGAFLTVWNDDPTVCLLQGSFIQFGSISSCLWSTTIGFEIFWVSPLPSPLSVLVCSTDALRNVICLVFL